MTFQTLSTRQLMMIILMSWIGVSIGASPAQADDPGSTQPSIAMANLITPFPGPADVPINGTAAVTTNDSGVCHDIEPVSSGDPAIEPIANSRFGYWLINSYQCQECDCFEGDGERITCPTSCLRYTRFDCGVGTRASNQTEFHQSLAPGVPIVVFAHGSLVTYERALADAHATWYWLRWAAPHLSTEFAFFMWPSDNEFPLVPQIDVGILGRRAARHGAFLASAVASVPSGHPICLIGHSHGCRTVCSALHLLAGGRVQDRCLCCPDPGNRVRAILIAAAMDHHWLQPDARYSRALCRTECLLNLQNRCDCPLALYPLRYCFSAHSLARAGFSEKVRRQMGPLNHRVLETDVTDLIGFGHRMGCYHEHSAIAQSLVPWIYDRESTIPSPPPPAAPAPPAPAPAVSE